MRSSLLITFLSAWVFLSQGVIGDPSILSDIFDSVVGWIGDYFDGSSDSSTTSSAATITPTTTAATGGTTTGTAAATTSAPSTTDDEYCADPTTTSTTGSTGSTSSSWLTTIWDVVSSWWSTKKKRDLDEFNQLSISPEIMARANDGNTNKISIEMIAVMGFVAILL